MAAHVYNVRSTTQSVFHTRFRGNRPLLASSIVALSMHLAALHFRPLQSLLGIAPFASGGWWRIGLVCAAVMLVSELHKWWQRAARNARNVT